MRVKNSHWVSLLVYSFSRWSISIMFFKNQMFSKWLTEYNAMVEQVKACLAHIMYHSRSRDSRTHTQIFRCFITGKVDSSQAFD